MCVATKTTILQWHLPIVEEGVLHFLDVLLLFVLVGSEGLGQLLVHFGVHGEHGVHDLILLGASLAESEANLTSPELFPKKSVFILEGGTSATVAGR